MSLELIRNPANSFVKAKKKRNMNAAVKDLLTFSFLLSVAMIFTIFKSSATLLMILSIGAVSFFMAILLAIVFGWTTQIIATTLGGKGKYYEGFATIVYSLAAPSIGLLIAAILTVVRGAWPISMAILFPSFALGVATFYRGIKEMFRLDTASAMATVAATIISFILTAYALVTLNLMSAGIV